MSTASGTGVCMICKFFHSAGDVQCSLILNLWFFDNSRNSFLAVISQRVRICETNYGAAWENFCNIFRYVPGTDLRKGMRILVRGSFSRNVTVGSYPSQHPNGKNETLWKKWHSWVGWSSPIVCSPRRPKNQSDSEADFRENGFLALELSVKTSRLRTSSWSARSCPCF